jgi:hypothetical protein
MRSLLVTLLLTILLPTAASAQSESADRAAIRATALDYIEGWYTHDAARMERALHPQLVKRRLISDAAGNAAIDEMTGLRLVQATRAPAGWTAPKLGNQRRDVAILDVFGNTASVKIDADNWVDYLHLVRTDGSWKILNVLWEPRTRP